MKFNFFNKFKAHKAANHVMHVEARIKPGSSGSLWLDIKFEIKVMVIVLVVVVIQIPLNLACIYKKKMVNGVCKFCTFSFGNPTLYLGKLPYIYMSHNLGMGTQKTTMISSTKTKKEQE